MRYLFAVRCPKCGDELHHVNSSNGEVWGERRAAIAHCLTCRREVSIFVQMVVREAKIAPAIHHDTDRGYFQHYKQGSEPCDDCKAAHARENKKHRTKVDA